MGIVSSFEPYSEVPKYENRLTWAFLVTLQSSSTLRNFFRELVLQRVPNSGQILAWETPIISTQVKFPQSNSPYNKLISVLLINDCNQQNVDVEWINYDRIYDGVVEYQNEGLIFIIENKPYGINQDQLYELKPSMNSFGNEVGHIELHPHAVCLEWSEILEGMLEYINSHSEEYNSNKIAGQFLSFIDRYFPTLAPYETFGICGNNCDALKKRATRIATDVVAMNGILESQDNCLFRPNSMARFICFSFNCESNLLQMKLWPGNLSWQSESLFANINQNDFFALNDNEPNISIKPLLKFYSLHQELSVGQNLDLRQYYNFFYAENEFRGGRLEANANVLNPLLQNWSNYGFIDDDIWNTIQNTFVDANYQYVWIAPGFEICQQWEIDTIIRWENDGFLNNKLISEINSVLDTWGEVLT